MIQLHQHYGNVGGKKVGQTIHLACLDVKQKRERFRLNRVSA